VRLDRFDGGGIGCGSRIHATDMKRHVIILGLVGGVLIAVLRWSEYQFLVIEHSFEIYGALVAVIFAGFGIWLGIKLTKPRETVVIREVQRPAVAPVPFTLNQPQVEAVGITPRELEILNLIAQGLSNREIADRLFVSENTVKTHCSRAFDKLGARRRTQAVQMGKQLGLLP
jgi:DNA-binding CsgD family transcriptional regulator